MSLIHKTPKRELLLTILIFAVILAYLICFGIINFLGFDNFCTTDMYEDTLIARLMWEQKTLFPDNYLFGNQLYVIATPVLAALFYGITGSMNTAMALATTVMSFLILLALDWMIKPFVKERHIRFAAMLALMAASFGPNTVNREDGQLFFVMCSFYACYLISFFFLMGDYSRARQSSEMRPAALVLALFLSFCTGMQSLRQTCVSMLPILFVEALCIAHRFFKKEELIPKDKRMSLIRAFAYLAANLLGLFTAKFLSVTRNEIYYGQSIFSGASIKAKFKDVHNAIVTVSGFDFCRDASNLFYIIIFLFFTLLIFTAIFILIRKRKFEGCELFWSITIISILAVIAASFVTSVKLRPIYIFPYYTLPALSLLIISGTIKPLHRDIICALLCVIAAFNIHSSYSDQIKTALTEEETVYSQAADLAISQGYEYVYGAHSHAAPQIAAASDGKLIAGCWEDDTIFKVSPHINIKDIYYLDDYSKAAFIFMHYEEELALHEAEANGTELEMLQDYGHFSMYSTSKQMLYPISESIGNYEVFPEYN